MGMIAPRSRHGPCGISTFDCPDYLRGVANLFGRSGEHSLHGGERHAPAGHFLESPLRIPGFQIHRSHSIFTYDNVQTRPTGIKRCRLHTVIGCQPSHEHASAPEAFELRANICALKGGIRLNLRCSSL